MKLSVASANLCEVTHIKSIFKLLIMKVDNKFEDNAVTFIRSKWGEETHLKAIDEIVCP